MSTSSNVSLIFVGQQITIYAGLVIFITGLFGNLLNIIIFLSLKTFRQSTCAFYLMIISFVNIGQLILGLLSRIMIYGFEIDWTATSLFYCKFRFLALLTCGILSSTCLCLATIDQYFATCKRPRWQQWSNIRVAQRLLLLFLVIIIILVLPYPIFMNHVTSSSGKTTCIMTNDVASRYGSYFIGLFPTGFMPDSITFIFGVLAYRNVQQIAYRAVPLVRRDLDKQLTKIVLVQVIVNLMTNVPLITMTATVFGTSSINDSVVTERIQFVYTVSIALFYSYFASPFYIYMAVSERFRRQCKHVLCDIYMSQWRQAQLANNQVGPIEVTKY